MRSVECSSFRAPDVSTSRCPWMKRVLSSPADTAIRELFLDGVTDVFEGFADLAPDATDGRPRLAGHFAHHTFVVKVRIAREVAGRLFDLAFQCFRLALEFIAIHEGLGHAAE